MKNILTLSELAGKVKNAVDDSFPSIVWVQAEISQLNVNAISGHCYLDLVEKTLNSDSFSAKMRATIWKNTYREISQKFESATNMPLANGLSVLVAVSVEFNQLYGLSLNVRDIDVSYSLGDMAKRRLEIIDTLRREGILEMNKLLHVATAPYRIAVISSVSAAGYEDFIHQLKHNKYGYVFYTRLYNAIMQGAQTEESILEALDRICDDIELFDCVVIIRGGGASSDLQAFDSLELSRVCAQYPLPIITGIGHTRDNSVLDIVANKSLKTPTAVAEFFISRMYDAECMIDERTKKLMSAVDVMLKREDNRMMYTSIRLSRVASGMLSEEINRMQTYKYAIKHTLHEYFSREKSVLMNCFTSIGHKIEMTFAQKSNEMEKTASFIHHNCVSLLNKHIGELDVMEQKLMMYQPEKMLQKGFTITECNGIIVDSSKKITPGAELTTYFSDGKVKSTVNN